MLAVVRLIGDQDVEVTAQHASSTSAAVTVRIGRALLYLNDQATAGHFHRPRCAGCPTGGRVRAWAAASNHPGRLRGVRQG